MARQYHISKCCIWIHGGDNEHEERDCCYVVYDDYGEDGQKMTDCVMYFSVWDIENIELK